MTLPITPGQIQYLTEAAEKYPSFLDKAFVDTRLNGLNQFEAGKLIYRFKSTYLSLSKMRQHPRIGNVWSRAGRPMTTDQKMTIEELIMDKEITPKKKIALVRKVSGSTELELLSAKQANKLIGMLSMHKQNIA